MNRNWINTFIGFVVLLLLQVFFFSQINLGVYACIYAYVLFILMLPAEFSPFSVLLLSAGMGLSVDVFSSEISGIHLSACSVVGYIRPYLLKRLASSNETQIEVPVIGKAPWSEYFTYTIILVLVHHLVFFTLESFDLNQILFILTRTLVSTLLTVIVVIILSLVVKKQS